MMFYSEALKKYFAKLFPSAEIFISSDIKEIELKKRATAKHPIIYIYDLEKPKSVSDQTGIDLTKEVKLDCRFSIWFVSMNIDEIISVEEKFSLAFSVPQAMTLVNDEHCIENATLELDQVKKISHKGIDTNIYQSIIPFCCRNIIWSMEVVNATKIELDKNIQLEVMQHLALLDMTWDKITQEMNQESDAGKKEMYIAQLQALKEQSASMYNFQNLCKADMSIEQQSFLRCYQLMEENDYGIGWASGTYKKEVAEDHKKKQYADRVFLKNGDEVLNRYTDAVIHDFKERMSLEYPIYVYGSSSFMKFYYDKEYNNLQFPIFQIEEHTNYTFENKKYYTESISGESIEHDYSADALPIVYGIIITIMTRDEDQIKYLQNKVTSVYKDGITLRIPDSIYENEFNVIKLSVEKSQPIEYVTIDLKSVFKTKIIFKRYPNVYYYKSYRTDEIENDLRLQIRQLQQAEFYLLARDKIKQDMLSPLEKYYSTIRNPQASFLGEALKSREYKQLKAQFLNYQPIDRALFETVFKSVVNFYPSFYEKAIRAWTYEQIKAEIEPYYKEMDDRYSVICTKLQLPYTIEGFVKGSGVTQNALVFYLTTMLKTPTCTLAEALKQYKKKSEEERIAREKEAEERARIARERAQYQSYNRSKDDDDDDGEGFFSKLLGSVGSRKEKNKKPDLWGTPYCIYGEPARKYRREASSYQTIFCAICPKHNRACFH